ncbi:MAG: crosslink repair DNA glycosylase YcaQ family protein, partial [Propionicimonas sp.]
LTLAELRPVLARLGGRLSTTTVDGVELWSGAGLGEARPHRAWLLSTFDEAYLTYPLLNFPRSPAHPAGEVPYRFAEAGGGVVICDLADVGGWKRRTAGGRVEVSLDLDPGLDGSQRAAIDEAADRLRAVIEG